MSYRTITDQPGGLITGPATLLIAALNRVTRLPIGDLVRPWAVPKRTCVACGGPVRDGEPFLRYRGEYYHAAPCLEHDPPALRQEGN